MNACVAPLTIQQNKKGYRHSAEPLLLADFIGSIHEDSEINNIIDLGTGSGITAILLSEYFKKAHILGVEIQPRLAMTAKKNVTLNNLEKRVKIIEGDIKHLPLCLQRGSFDLAVSNPPFRKAGSGRLNPDSEKAIAKHEIKITLTELLHSCNILLKVRGRLVIVYHPERLDELLHAMSENGINPGYLKFVHPGPDSDACMVLVEGVKKGKHRLRCLPPVFLDTKNH